MTVVPIALGLLLAGASPAEPKVFDRVVATIDGDVITLSELEFETRVEIVSRGGSNAALNEISHSELSTFLAVAIQQRLAAKEAQRLGIYEITSDQLAKAEKVFKDYLPIGLDQFLAVNEVSRVEFDRLIRRDLQVASYLKSRTELHSPVTDAEVDRAIAQQTADPAAKSSKLLRDKVREDLTAVRDQQLVLTELRRLYARAKVRIVDPSFSGADAQLQPGQTGG